MSELDKLLTIFDLRNSHEGGITASASGTVFQRSEASGQGLVLFPVYNATGVVLDDLYDKTFVRAFGFKLAFPWRPNFVWAPFDIRSYFRAHEPLAPGFAKTHGVSYYSVMAALAALGFRVLRRAILSRGETLMALWQKAYEGPYSIAEVRQEVHDFAAVARELLQMTDAEWRQVDLEAGMKFWTLTDSRSDIDLMYAGPHSLFLPFGRDRMFLDYAWIWRRIYDLFVGVSIPDQNFKGVALEELVRGGSSALPVGPCSNARGEQRQIDAAFRIGKRLVIAECRAVARSIGFDRGDPEAIRYRQDLVERTLADVDAKARWLAESSKGRNYDISWAETIIPVGVTPFVEFMPSLSTHYWLLEGLARVLTPRELRTALDNKSMMKVSQNTVSVKRRNDIQN